MAEFKGAISYYGNANDGSMTVPLSNLSVSEGDTVLLVWRLSHDDMPATPDGWELIAEKVEFWQEGMAPFASAPAAFRYANVYRLDAEGSLGDLSVPLSPGQHTAGLALVLTLAEGEEIGGWRTGVRQSVALNDPVNLSEPSVAGQTFVLTDFDVYGLI